MTSCMQTVEVYYPGTTKKYFTMGIAPPVPKNVSTECNAVVNQYAGVTTTWYPDRTEEFHCWTGVLHVYWKRPSLQDVLSWNLVGQYYRRHSDGVVEYGLNGEYYRWERDVEVDDRLGGYISCGCGYSFLHDPYVSDEDDTYDDYYYGGKYDNN
jgi:hypothetical protein